MGEAIKICTVNPRIKSSRSKLFRYNVGIILRSKNHLTLLKSIITSFAIQKFTFPARFPLTHTRLFVRGGQQRSPPRRR